MPFAIKIFPNLPIFQFDNMTSRRLNLGGELLRATLSSEHKTLVDRTEQTRNAALQETVYRRYGLTLRRISKEDIEKVREWRNSPEISQFMECREYIGLEDQAKWFNSINNKENYYFIVNYESHDIGLVNLKNINFHKNEAESGSFLLEKYWGTNIPALAAFALFDFAFEKLKLSRSTAHILRTNERAISYTRKLGFQICPGQDNIENQMYVLTREVYFKKNKQLRDYFHKINSGDNADGSG